MPTVRQLQYRGIQAQRLLPLSALGQTRVTGSVEAQINGTPVTVERLSAFQGALTQLQPAILNNVGRGFLL